MRLLQLALPVLALTPFASPWSIAAREDTRKRAAYTLNNDATGAQLVSFKISVADGTLSHPVATDTGGKGLLGRNGNKTAGPDGLFGQGAVEVSQSYVFTVNPGSNTLSMFFVTPEDPYHPELVGRPVHTIGDFPMSVTYSSTLKTACVLNGGSKAGVACFHADHAKGLSPIGDLRPIKLSQSTPPSGPPDTSSQIQFNPSSSAVFATIKGDAGSKPPQNGFIYAWPVQNGQISTQPVVSVPAPIVMDFSIDFLGSDSSALIADPSFGASIVSISPSFEVSERVHVVIPNQGAACWGVYAPRFNSAYVIDAGHPNITIVDPASGAKKGAIQLSDVTGGFDTAIDRTWMYVLSGSGTIAVVDLAGSNSGKVPRQVQNFDLSSVGSPTEFQGMAVYPS